ncbi:MAG: nicotinate (nicotinamide) nucleotide adenylyltransferase [Planctomycetes bacterium]|nr:nicotinate (nicotinamide) nucleotide adenylyltransferase [Planctomycetota bacterium]
MRVGVFGGTFDPVHLGHLILAEQCREQAALDRVLFVPSARPPHKLDQDMTPFAQRVEMLALAIAGHAAFAIDELEKDRPGPSFTADTLRQLKEQDAHAQLFLMLGADALNDLPMWHGPQQIAALANLLVVARPGSVVPPPESIRAKLSLPLHAPLAIQVVQSPGIDIASRDLRRRAAAGQSLRFLVPRAVEIYIQERRLYRTQP